MTGEFWIAQTFDPARRAEPALALSVVARVHILSRGQIVHSSAPAELMASEDVKSRYLGVA